MQENLLVEPQKLRRANTVAGRWARLLGAGLLLLAGRQAHAQTPLSGAYTINNLAATGGTNFASFTDAATALNTNGVSGPVTISVSNGPYTEQFQLEQVAGTSATNTIVVNGNGRSLAFGSRTTAQRAVVQLNGTDYTTINNLAIDATGSTYGYGVLLTNAADNDKITNNTIDADIATTSTNFVGIAVNGSTSSATTSGNSANNLLIQGNTVRGGYYGITLYGNTSTALNTGNAVRNNTVRDFYTYGIYTGYQDGAQFIGNDISRPTRTNPSSFYGIYAFGSSRSLTIEKNRLHDPFTGNPTSTNFSYVIYLATSTGATATTTNDVVNNVLYNLNGNSGQYLIYNSGAAYSRIYNNTISSEDQTVTTTSTTYGIYNSGANVDVRNNVISITRTGTGTKYGLYYSTAAATSNYNDLYVPTGNVGYSGAAYATLTAWQGTASSAFDQNSISENPLFAAASTGNLVPVNGALNNAGTPLARVTDDITGATRGAIPDLGAYEFTPPPIDLAPVALLSPAATTLCYGASEPVSIQVRNNGSATLSFATNPLTLNVVVTMPGGGTQPLSSTTSTGTLASGATLSLSLPALNMTTLGTYSFAVTATVTGDANPSNDVLTPAPTRTVLAPTAGTASPAAADLCISGTITLTLAGSANGTIQWQQSPNGTTYTDIAGANAATFTTPTLTSTTYYRARTGCNANVVTSNVAVITVNNPQVLTAATTVSVCAGATATLTATGSTGATLNYYDAATGGPSLGTGPSFTTPAIMASRQYYVGASVGSATTVGPATNAAVGANAAVNLTYGLIFTVLSPTTLTGVYVYPGTAGTSRIEYQTSASVVIQSTTATFTSADIGQKTYVPLNFQLQAGTDFRLMMTSTGSTATLSRNTAGASYPYTSGNGNVSITNNTFTGYPQYYYYFYDWQIGGECASATRTAIQVNVTPGPTATLTATAQPNGAILLTSSTIAGATYQFFRNGTAVGPASTTSTLVLPSSAQNGSYTVVVTPATGCASLPSAAVAATVLSANSASLTGVSLHVYPNPTPDGTLTLELTGPRAQASQLTVLDALGHVVHTSALATGTATLRLPHLAAGMYLLQVKTPDGMLSQRLVRE